MRLIKWRTGSEGRISSLKRTYGWSRTLTDGLDGAQTWCGFGILAHNAVKISGLIEDKHRRHIQRVQKRPPQPAATGPPPNTASPAA